MYECSYTHRFGTVVPHCCVWTCVRWPQQDQSSDVQWRSEELPRHLDIAAVPVMFGTVAVDQNTHIKRRYLSTCVYLRHQLLLYGTLLRARNLHQGQCLCGL